MISGWRTLSSIEKLDTLPIFKQHKLTAIKLSEVRVAYHKPLDFNAECPVCMSKLREGDEVTTIKVKKGKIKLILPVAFHSKCLSEYLRKNNAGTTSTPTCKDSPDSSMQMRCNTESVHE
jgi:hypothetical protein